MKIDTNRYGKIQQCPLGTKYVDVMGLTHYYAGKKAERTRAMKIGDKVTVTTTKSARCINLDGRIVGCGFAYRKKGVVIAMECKLPTFFNDGHEPSNDTIIGVDGGIVFIHHSYLEPVEPEPNLRRKDIEPQYEVGTKYCADFGKMFIYVSILFGDYIEYRWLRVR